MKAAALTNKGMEEIAADEVKEMIGIKTITEPFCVIFDVERYEDLFKLCYLARSITKVCILLDCFQFKNLEDVTARIQKLKLLEASFAVKGLRVGKHDCNTMSLEQAAGKGINGDADYKNPETVFFIGLFDSKCYFGIDLCSEDLAKRDYRIFVGADSLKGNVAFAMLKLAGYEKKKSLLDPFCKNGIIPIEAALIAAEASPNYFKKDKFLFTRMQRFADYETNELLAGFDHSTDFKAKAKITAMDTGFAQIQNAKKNAKIAGVNDLIDFSKLELEWLDTKFSDESIDCIVTVPLQPGLKHDQKQLEKHYNKFFSQAAAILKKDGVIVLAIKRGDETIKAAAARHNFIPEKELDVWQGEERIRLIKLVSIKT